MNFISYIKTKKYAFITLLYALLSSALTYYCLELGNKNPFMNGFFYTFVNIITIFLIQAVLYLFLQRWWLSSVITSVPLTILSIANYYTLLYRNQPISTQDIHNAGTTLSVLGSYKFPISVYIIAIIVFFILNLLVVCFLFSREKGSRIRLKSILIKNVCIVLFTTLFLNTVYFGEYSIKPRNTFVWSWEDSYHTYGYAASSIEVLQNSINMVDMPKDYSTEKVLAFSEKTPSTEGSRLPDVILILNETFYDLRDLLELETDTEIMPYIDSLENSIKGRAVVAGTGGGTNKSEYELLTSNSIQLMPGITPFNYLEFKNSNSVVSYLKSLGYQTWAAHCAESLNYSREHVYPELGFEQILFDKDFGDKEKYGQRPYATDQFCYKKLIEDYEKMSSSPRFMYMLSIQNHGGWELNDDSYDSVHSLTDFGEYTDDVNEFLSCVNLSDMAFKDLTEYFSKSERPVIICMVGDHSPSFATELVDTSSIDTVFKLRSTPYIMWANFETESIDAQALGMPSIIPNMLRAADMPISSFYSYMLEMQKETPVITAFNTYCDKDGNRFKYSDISPHTNTINGYFNLVYNNVNMKGDRIQEIFEP